MPKLFTRMGNRKPVWSGLITLQLSQKYNSHLINISILTKTSRLNKNLCICILLMTSGFKNHDNWCMVIFDRLYYSIHTCKYHNPPHALWLQWIYKVSLQWDLVSHWWHAGMHGYPASHTYITTGMHFLKNVDKIRYESHPYISVYGVLHKFTVNTIHNTTYFCRDRIELLCFPTVRGSCTQAPAFKLKRIELVSGRTGVATRRQRPTATVTVISSAYRSGLTIGSI